MQSKPATLVRREDERLDVDADRSEITTALGKERRVVVFRKLLLPVSETFILDQVSTYRRWSPTLLGYRRVPGLDLDGVGVVTVMDRPSWDARLRLKLYQHGQYAGYIPGALVSLVAAQRPRLIHAHFAYDAILVSGVARRLGLPLVVTLHGDDILRAPEVWRSGRKGQFFRLYPRALARLFHDPGVRFIAVSQAVAEAAVSRGAVPERVHVRYTGTHLAPARNPESQGREPRVLFVGRLVAFKGCAFLIEAMARVRRAVPQARLTVIGDGPQRAELVAQADRLGGGVEFLGAVGRTVVRAHMAAARVFCLPSVTDPEGVFEAFGMVILEAMAMGLAVVTSARGGREAIEHGDTGFVTSEGDAAALAEHIVQLLGDDALARLMAGRAQAHVAAAFNLETCTAAIEDLYDEILDDVSERGPSAVPSTTPLSYKPGSRPRKPA